MATERDVAGEERRDLAAGLFRRGSRRLLRLYHSRRGRAPRA